MKANRIEHKKHTGLILVAATVVLIGLCVGAVIGYGHLRDIYQEQCVITDMNEQVKITAGKMVLAGTIAEELGLRPGANLATIDFVQKRRDLLDRIHNLRDIKISRILPDKVVIVAEERTPIAKMGVHGDRSVTGRVVDTDGMVFVWQRGTQTLPTIREAPAGITEKGKRITRRTLAALRLIEACREPGLIDLGVLEVDVTKPDFLTVTLGNYSRVKICWKEMDEHTPAAREDLYNRLDKLQQVKSANVSSDVKIWNATMPDTIFADPQQTP